MGHLMLCVRDDLRTSVVWGRGGVDVWRAKMRSCIIMTGNL